MTSLRRLPHINRPLVMEPRARMTPARAFSYRYGRELVPLLPADEASALQAAMACGESIQPILARLRATYALPLPTYLAAIEPKGMRSCA